MNIEASGFLALCIIIMPFLGGTAVGAAIMAFLKRN